MSIGNKKRARIIRRRLRFGPTIARVFALIVLTVLAVIALASSTNSAINSYKKSDLTSKEADLETEVDELRFWVNRAETLKSIKENQDSNLVPIDNPEHMDGKEPEGEVAGESTENPEEAQ